MLFDTIGDCSGILFDFYLTPLAIVAPVWGEPSSLRNPKPKVRL
jgi:hypothetical protein